MDGLESGLMTSNGNLMGLNFGLNCVKACSLRSVKSKRGGSRLIVV
jgi:hypothetical protein